MGTPQPLLLETCSPRYPHLLPHTKFPNLIVRFKLLRLSCTRRDMVHANVHMCRIMRGLPAAAKLRFLLVCCRA